MTDTTREERDEVRALTKAHLVNFPDSAADRAAMGFVIRLCDHVDRLEAGIRAALQQLDQHHDTAHHRISTAVRELKAALAAKEDE